VIPAVRLAWLQLRWQPGRLAIAIAGVAFAVLLMVMQLGFRDALFRSALNVPNRIEADLVLVDPRYGYITLPGTVPRARLVQALAYPEVASVSPLYVSPVDWRNPETGRTRRILAVGVDPTRGGFDVGSATVPIERLRHPDAVLFDARGRREFGPVAALFERDGRVPSEVNRHRVTVEGLFTMGSSFGIDGTIVASDDTFLRFTPQRVAGAPSIGLVRLAPGADPAAVRARLARDLPSDVHVLTMDDLAAREVAYWAASTPIGYVFTFGAVMGIVVGAIIVYQILFADIADHLAEYATLKAMGYGGGYLAAVVLAEAVVLAVLGFLPGTAVSAWFSNLTASATGLPMRVSPDGATMVLGFTIGMCCVSGLLAMRKLRRCDPASVF
jgi:putative ABC transport system permease protein